MKFLLSLSFLLFAAATSINASSFFAEGPTPPPILDASGAPLQFGVPYYMLAVLPIWKGRGVCLGSASPFESCSKLIQLNPDMADRGTPVVFSSAVHNVTGNITIGSELIINFNLTRPNDESCGGSNSTTWMMARKGNLAVGGEAMSNVFRLSLSEVPHSYLLNQVIYEMDVVVGVMVTLEWGRFLMVQAPKMGYNLSFGFIKAKNTEEDEDDKPVIIQMPRKMSVLRV